MTTPSLSTCATLLPALTQQLHVFVNHLDESRYQPLVDMFADDCRWLRQGRWLDGKAAVLEALQQRPLDSQTRHVITNAFVSNADGDTATLEAYMTAYRYPTAQAGALPRAAGPLRINLVTTRFRQEVDGEWRIVEQQLLPAVGFGA